MPSFSSGQFTNTWTTLPGPIPSHSLYATSKGLNTDLRLGSITEGGAARANNISTGSYAVVHGTTSAGGSLLADVYGLQDLLTIPQDLWSQYRTPSTSMNDTYAPISTIPARSPCSIQQQSQDNSRALSRLLVPAKFLPRCLHRSTTLASSEFTY